MRERGGGSPAVGEQSSAVHRLHWYPGDKKKQVGNRNEENGSMIVAPKCTSHGDLRLSYKKSGA